MDMEKMAVNAHYSTQGLTAMSFQLPMLHLAQNYLVFLVAPEVDFNTTNLV